MQLLPHAWTACLVLRLAHSTAHSNSATAGLVGRALRPLHTSVGRHNSHSGTEEPSLEAVSDLVVLLLCFPFTECRGPV